MGHDANDLAALHAQGRKVMAYISAGAWLADDNQCWWPENCPHVPEGVKGNQVLGYPGTVYLDIRNLAVLGPIMERLLDLAVAKGFDGVGFDIVHGYAQDTGFPLTYQDQLTYNTFLANAAHACGLSAGFENNLGQIPDMVPLFDWVISEYAVQFNEAHRLLPFVEAGKAVFLIEYEIPLERFCPQAEAMGFNAIRKSLVLDAYREACRTPAPTPQPTPTPKPAPAPQPAPTPVPGVASASLDPETIEARPGDEFVLAVAVDPQGHGLSGGEVLLTFPSDVLEVVSYEPGTLLGPNPIFGVQHLDQSSGSIRIALGRLGSTPVPTEAGDLLVVRFRVKRTASTGNGQVILIPHFPDQPRGCVVIW